MTITRSLPICKPLAGQVPAWTMRCLPKMNLTDFILVALVVQPFCVPTDQHQPVALDPPLSVQRRVSDSALSLFILVDQFL